MNICKNLKGVLLSAPSFCLKVHSVFPTTVNLSLQQEIFMTLTAEEKGAMPYSISLPGSYFTALTKGDLLWVQKGELLLCGEKISLADLPVTDHTIRPISPSLQKLSAQLDICRQMLADSSSVFSSVFGLCPATVESRFIGDDVQQFIRCPCDASSAAIWGFGPGLTPSCDDFLRGWCVAAIALGDDFSLSLPTNTTAVSRYWMKLTYNHLWDPTCAQFFSALQGSESDLSHAAKALLGIGHTSGADILWGIVLYLSNLL